MARTIDDLIEDVRRKGSFPESDSLFSNADYLNILQDEFLTQIVPLLISVNEEYFLEYKDSPLVSGQDSYRMPARAMAGTLRNVQLVDSSGNIKELYRLWEEDKSFSQEGYYIKGNKVILSPSPTDTTLTLRQSYLKSPSTFVLESSCAQVTSISGNDVVVSSLPSTITTGISVDVIQGSSPYDVLASEEVLSGQSGTTLSFSSIPDDITVGDWVCLTGQSCLPLLPEEFIPLLTQAALVSCLASKQDKSHDRELQKLEMMKQSFIKILQPRVKSDDKKIRSSNGFF